MSDHRAGLFHDQQHSEPNTEDLTGVTSLITLFLVTEGLFLSNTHGFHAHTKAGVHVNAHRPHADYLAG